MSDHAPPTDDELAKWTRYYVGADPQTRHALVTRRLIEEVQRLRVALAREVRQWALLEQDIGGYAEEERKLQAEIERLRAENKRANDEFAAYRRAALLK